MSPTRTEALTQLLDDAAREQGDKAKRLLVERELAHKGLLALEKEIERQTIIACALSTLSKQLLGRPLKKDEPPF